MSKFKGILAAAVACFMAINALSVIESDAAVYYPTGVYDITTPPEGCEEFESTEMYQKYSEYFTPDDLMYYRSTKNPCCFAGYYYFDFSRVDITTTNDGWEEIYNKYNEVLNMDFAELLSDGKTVRIMDCVNLRSETDYGDDSDAAIMERYDAIGKKYGILKEMCEEMYEAGCIESAEYRPFYGSGTRYKTFDFFVKGYTGLAENLEAVVVSAYEYAVVEATATEGNYRVKVCTEDDSTAEDFFAVLDAVKAMDSDFEIGVSLEVLDESVSVSSMLSEVSDMLADAVSSPADINSDGKTSILDIITLSKAASGIVSLNEECTVIADLNSNGAVDSGDVTLLMQYLVGLIDTM